MAAKKEVKAAAAVAVNVPSFEKVVEAFQRLSRTEGIIPALEPAHALAWVLRAAPELQGQTVLLNLSGRGDKDVGQMMELLQL